MPPETTVGLSPDARYRRRRRKAEALGLPWHPFVNADRAFERLVELRDAGWSRDALAAAFDLSPCVIERIRNRQRTKIRPETERKILFGTLDPRRIPGHLLIPSAGTQRRIQALNFMGWSYPDLARESGLAPHVFDRAQHRQRVNAGLAATVADVYDRLWRRPGPTVSTATRARRHGRHGPLAWDDETIDDPRARPDGARIPWPR